MKKYSNSSLNEIVLKSSKLNQICNRSKYIEELNKHVKSYIPNEYRDFCKVVNFRRNSLILTIPSPSWKHKLKFYTPTLINKLKKNKIFKGLKNIEYIITWENVPLPTQKKLPQEEKKPNSLEIYGLLRPSKVSKQEQEVVLKLSKQIKSDNLKSALLKLVNLKNE